ncbi:hypothetical protein Bca4012_026055 [Brassica carinata]
MGLNRESKENLQYHSADVSFMAWNKSEVVRIVHVCPLQIGHITNGFQKIVSKMKPNELEKANNFGHKLQPISTTSDQLSSSTKLIVPCVVRRRGLSVAGGLTQ